MSYTNLARFNNYSPESFGWGGSFDPKLNPEVLVPFTYKGARFGQMHKYVVGLFTALLDELVPHIAGGLLAHNDEGCYNPKSVTVGGTRSFHTYGIAIDVNWVDNPMGAKHRPTGPNALPPITSQIARDYGCEWGGDWSYPQDWMHIECHLPPSEAHKVLPIVRENEMELTDKLTVGLTHAKPNPTERTVEQVLGYLNDTVYEIQQTVNKLAVEVDKLTSK